MKTQLLSHKTSMANYGMLTSMFVLCTVFLLTTMGALNSGTALSAGIFDPIVSLLENFLVSTFLIFLALLVLLVIVVRLGQGAQGGYILLFTILGILILGIFGPSLIKQFATAIGEAGSILELPKF